MRYNHAVTVRWETVLVGSVKWVLVPAVLAGVGYLFIGPNLDDLGSAISRVTPPSLKAVTAPDQVEEDEQEPEVTIEATFRPTPVRTPAPRRAAPRPKPAEPPPAAVTDDHTGDDAGADDIGSGGNDSGAGDAGSGGGGGTVPPPDDGLSLGSRRTRDAA